MNEVLVLEHGIGRVELDFVVVVSQAWIDEVLRASQAVVAIWASTVGFGDLGSLVDGLAQTDCAVVLGQDVNSLGWSVGAERVNRLAD